MFQSEKKPLTKLIKTKKSLDLRPGSDLEKKASRAEHRMGSGGYGSLDGSLARDRLKVIHSECPSLSRRQPQS